MPEFEDVLRGALSNMATGYTPSADLGARIGTAIVRRERNHRLVVAATIATFLLLFAGVAAVTTSLISTTQPAEQAGPHAQPPTQTPPGPGSPNEPPFTTPGPTSPGERGTLPGCAEPSPRTGGGSVAAATTPTSTGASADSLHAASTPPTSGPLHAYEDYIAPPPMVDPGTSVKPATSCKP